jgi:hypothetical protein
MSDWQVHHVAELLRLKNRIDTICNNVLCDMTPGYDDSIEGFNKAWDVVRDIFQEEIGRATRPTITDEMAAAGAKAMVLLCQDHRDRGGHLPSRLQEALACLNAALSDTSPERGDK